MDIEALRALLALLVAHPTEVEWVEFKENNSDPELIGENLSSLSNSAKRVKQPFGYLVYGVEDGTHKVTGTAFKPSTTKIRGQVWKMWMTHRINPHIWFDIFEFDTLEGIPISIIRVPQAPVGPLTFNKQAWIRIQSCNKKLSDFREIEHQLWVDKSDLAFEGGLATESMSASRVLSLLDTKTYYDLLLGDQSKPTTVEGLIAGLLEEGLVHQDESGAYAVTNVGALLLANDMKHFPALENKTAWMLIYEGKGNLVKRDEVEGKYGYARAFERIIKYIMDATPKNEVIEGAIRKETKMYPPVALRELLANAFVHQDFTKPGRPTVEIYSDRIEFTNPGEPRVQSDLWVVESVARNERLANLLKKLHICEKRGSGIRRVFHYVETYQLPAPKFTNTDFTTKATIYSHQEFRDMDRADKIRACYQHCCLRYVQNEKTTNTSVRQRFGIAKRNSAQATKIINDTFNARLIILEDPDNKSFKYNKYIPHWADARVVHNENIDRRRSSHIEE